MSVIYYELPKLTPLPEKNLYKLTESLKIVYQDDEQEMRAVTVPEGFETDGASIPRILWEEIGNPFTPKFMTAAIVHDYMCVMGKDKYPVDLMSDLFFDLLRHDGVGFGKAFAMETAVRLYKSLF